MTETAVSETPQRLVAVIDIGATSVRMMIAQIRADGEVSHLENLSQAVKLGRDSFVSGRIRRATIEDCVRVLKIFRRKLTEYEIARPEQVRVVATSAVREASNRLAFLDRVYIATGFNVEPFDEAQLHRVTYLGIRPILDANPELLAGQTVICEVGGGSTETLVMNDGRVTFAQTWRLGVLRLIHSLEASDVGQPNSRRVLESRIAQTAKQIAGVVNRREPVRLIAMGSEMRLAVQEISGGIEALEIVDVARLREFADQILRLNPDRLVTRYQLSIQEAESLGPALLINAMIARRLELETVHVARVNLRDGLIKEMLAGRQWVGNAEEQVIDSALTLGRRFSFDEAHARHVARLGVELFRQTTALHQLPDRWEIDLHLAALLHEVGLAIGERSYHKHSQYIIRNSVFFGVSSRELNLIALVARYHRRALPQRTHDVYSQLDQDDRVAVSKLAALLRIAKALDAGRNQSVQEIRAVRAGNTLRVEAPGLTDVSIEQLELRRQQELFEYVFGLNVELSAKPGFV